MPETQHPSGLSAEKIAELRSLAAEAAKRAYAPYSSFRVGAAVLLEDGRVFTGANIENASYRLTICAEHTAIAKAVSEVGAGMRIRAVAVENLNNAGSFPCGACRQIILEFGGPETWVFAPSGKGHEDAALGSLLPHGFHLDAD